MALVELQAGSTFAGRYQVVRRLARGGMGAVYEVIHLSTHRRRALKVMLPELFQKPELRDRFAREAHVTASVKSEFLVDVFDAGVDPESQMPFLVMELLEGEDLGRMVERSGPLPRAEVVGHLAQVANAIDKTHAASIVHRDLKPENLFLTRRDDGTSSIKILDFGISKIVNESATAGRNTTSIGTPAYMAPEQIVGGTVTPAADVHALGLIAFTLLTGRAYWQDDVESTDNALAFALRAAQGIKEGAVSRARRHGHELPQPFDAWFARAAALDPKSRFPSATEAVLSLSECLAVPPPALLTAPRVTGARSTPASTPPDPIASTMHGAEVGLARTKPSALLVWLAAGAALGLAGIFLSLFLSGGDSEPIPADAPPEPVSGAASAPSLVPDSRPVVAPIEPLVVPSSPAASTTTSAAPPGSSVAIARPERAPELQAAARPSSVRERETATKNVPIASSEIPSVAPSATGSFPLSTARPRIKHTRD